MHFVTLCRTNTFAFFLFSIFFLTLTHPYFSQKPVYCLKVTVKEAKGILGKDISGMGPKHVSHSFRVLSWGCDFKPILLQTVKKKEITSSTQSKKLPLSNIVPPLPWMSMAGFSDPYCLLTILHKGKLAQSGTLPPKPQKAVVKDSAEHGEVFQTNIKKQTLNPVWDETFALWVFGEKQQNTLHCLCAGIY